MRFSKREAEAEAVGLAEEFVAADGGAERACGRARPDVLVNVETGEAAFF